MERAKYRLNAIARATAARSLKRLSRDSSGATAVEFAIVAVPFFGLLLLVLQVGLYFFSLQSLDYATRLAGRDIMTGGVAANITTANQFRNSLICPRVFWAITCNSLVINTYVVGKSSNATGSTGVYAFINAANRSLNAAQTDPNKQSFCLGGPGDYVYVDVAYNYPNFVMKLLSATAGATMSMRSGTMVYNEPTSASRSC